MDIILNDAKSIEGHRNFETLISSARPHSIDEGPSVAKWYANQRTCVSLTFILSLTPRMILPRLSLAYNKTNKNKNVFLYEVALGSKDLKPVTTQNAKYCLKRRSSMFFFFPLFDLLLFCSFDAGVFQFSLFSLFWLTATSQRNAVSSTITEVKQYRAGSIFRWTTAWEYQVL